MSRQWNQFRPLTHIPLIFGGLILVTGLAFLFGLFVMWLWNWLMPDLFGLGPISYWQGWGLVLLANLLFKIGPHHYPGRAHRSDEEWKERLRARFKKRDNEREDTSEAAEQI